MASHPGLEAVGIQLQENQINQLNGPSLDEAPKSEAGQRVSEERYWAEYYENSDFHYEWNDGILEEKPMPDKEQFSVHDWFLGLLREFVKAHPIADVLYLEIGIRLALSHKTTIRKPDIFVVRHDNPIQFGGPDRSYRGICDLCIESLSDSTLEEVRRDTVDKKTEYAFGGVREYYILDARRRHTAFYRRTSAGSYTNILPTADGVIRSQALPNFQFRVEDLYRQPSLMRLVDDQVYRGFVMLEYQAASRRAEQEQRRAEQEQKRAEEEYERAERYAAKLRELGIDIGKL